MDKDTVTLRIRERLDARMLPRVIPSLMREPGRPTSPRGNFYKDSSIGVAKCAACDDPGAQIAYQSPDRRILLLLVHPIAVISGCQGAHCRARKRHYAL